MVVLVIIGLYIIRKEISVLKIYNLKWKYQDFNNLNAVIKDLNDKFKTLNIATKVSLKEDEKAIAFSDIVDGKTFVSNVDNKIDMKENDPRIKKTGRTYLLSKRPTEEQYNGFFNIIQSTLDTLNVAAKVELVIPRTSQTIVLRDGMIKYDRIPKMKSFPIKIKGA